MNTSPNLSLFFYLMLNNQNLICDVCKSSNNPLNELSSLNLNNTSSHFDSISSPNLILNNEKFNEINDLFCFKKVA